MILGKFHCCKWPYFNKESSHLVTLLRCHFLAPHIAPFQYFVQCVPILQKSFQSQISCSSDALKLTYHCSLLNDKKWTFNTSAPYHQSQSGDGYDVTWQRTTNGRAPNWRLWRCQASVFGSGTKIDFVGTFSACHHQRSILDQKLYLAKICSFKRLKIGYFGDPILKLISINIFGDCCSSLARSIE